MLSIKPCTMDAVSGFILDARRSGLVFSKSTEMYGIWLEENLIGMCGLVRYRNHWKFKNDYIIPEYRRRGYCREALIIRLDMARAQGARFIEATCTEMSISIWLKLGAVIMHQYKLYTKVRLII